MIRDLGTSRMLLAVSITQRYPGHSRQAGHIASQCHAGAYCGKYVIVVDDDVDVSNLEGNFTNSRAIIDACRPFHWRDKFPKVNMPSPETARRAREKFGYLLK